MRPFAASLAAAAVLCLGLASARADTLEVDLGAGEKLELVRIAKGSFVEGSPAGETGRAAEETQHEVKLTEDFYLGNDEVTVGQFKRFVADTGYRTEAERGDHGGSGWDGHALVQRKDFTWQHPGYPVTDKLPVTLVTSGDALAFTAWLTRREGRTFTLPTEAEWEYAARGGTTTAWPGATDGRGALALGWFKQNSPSGPHPVGETPANPFGLHDMFGNAAEWCLDVEAPYPTGAVTDPLSTTGGAPARQVLRGGSWARDVRNGRAASRHANTAGSRNADNGFRVRASARALAPAASPSAANPATPQPVRARDDGSTTRSTTTTTDNGSIAIALAVFVGAFAIVGIAGYALLRRRREDRLGAEPSFAPAPPFAPAPAPAFVPAAAAPPIGFRLAPDGVWIDAPPQAVGQSCHYRFRTDAGVREGQVDLEGTAGGQFVYTGARPLEAVLVGLARAAVGARPVQRGAGYRPQPYVQNTGWVATSNITTSSSTIDDDPPGPQAFGGFPSAY